MQLLDVDNLFTSYRSHGRTLKAVDDVSFSVGKGETVGLVGESGCGKSTLGKTILRLVPCSGGQIRFAGTDIAPLSGRALMPYRRRMQMVFQDPFGSLNPRQTVRTLLDTALKVHGRGDTAQRSRLIDATMDRVGLPRTALSRYPHEFSGGQRQRIGIARALILEPELVVCDEPVSALDVSIQAQILNLLVDLKRDLGLSYLFISHDMSVVRYFTDRVMVMYLGRIVESGSYDTLWSNPLHPYTRALINAVPSYDAQKKRTAVVLKGDLPSASQVPSGCRFRLRCRLAQERCSAEEPTLRPMPNGQNVACHFA
ncbi:ABC transporter ATP-binding protein [Bradyrhizobium cenepequi]